VLEIQNNIVPIYDQLIEVENKKISNKGSKQFPILYETDFVDKVIRRYVYYWRNSCENLTVIKFSLDKENKKLSIILTCKLGDIVLSNDTIFEDFIMSACNKVFQKQNEFHIRLK
jgi:hypothetical protein